MGKPKNEEKKAGVGTFLLLHGLMLLYSFVPVCSKLAGGYPLFSLGFSLFYGLLLLLLGAYALLWQQILKKVPLTTAYASKAVTVVWGMLWGLLFFTEAVTLQKCVGAVVIIAGVLLFSSAERTQGEKEAPDA